MQKVRLVAWVEPEQKEFIQQQAKKEKVSESEIVRKAIQNLVPIMQPVEI